MSIPQIIVLVLLGFLALFFWFWPILFVGFGLRCIKSIVRGEGYEKDIGWTILGLVCMVASIPALSLLLMILF